MEINIGIRKSYDSVIKTREEYKIKHYDQDHIKASDSKVGIPDDRIIRIDRCRPEQHRHESDRKNSDSYDPRFLCQVLSESVKCSG